MILISHRGNLNGLNPEKENSINYIDLALSRGYDVEIDIWYENKKFWLGHDNPQYEIKIETLLERKNKLWVHCKNFKALTFLINSDLRVFFHEFEQHTIISNGLIWSHNIEDSDEKCIIPLLSKQDVLSFDYKSVYGICSDYVELLK